MAVLYTQHEDRKFVEAICSYQKGDTNPLYSWIDKQTSISNIDQVHEIIYQVFMIADCFFINGTSDVFTKAFNKMDLKTEDKLSYIGKHEICPNVWFEKPEDFKRLFYSYEKAFCSKELNIYSKMYKTVSDHFSHERTNTLKGFWKSIENFHMYAKSQENGIHNLIPNVELWLTKTPCAKEFVEPYCLPIKGEVNFSHIAYAYLNNGFDIERKILNLYPKKNPEKLEPFAKAAYHCELQNALEFESIKSSPKKIKL